MCLLYLIAALGIILTVVSGQYQEHMVLFWAFLVATAATGMFYSVDRRIRTNPEGIGRGTRLTIEVGTGVCGFATLGLFIWLCVVIWL